MDKYYKAEDVINKVVEYISIDYPTEERAREDAELLFADLPTIEVMEYPQVEGITPTLVTPEVSEDCISRKWLEKHKEVISYTNGWRETETDEFVSWKNIKNAPPVVPQSKEGEWIPDPDGGFRCSNCRAEEDEFIYGIGMRHVNGESEFCPNCGVKMKGAENE